MALAESDRALKRFNAHIPGKEILGGVSDRSSDSRKTDDRRRQFKAHDRALLEPSVAMYGMKRQPYIIDSVQQSSPFTLFTIEIFFYLLSFLRTFFFPLHRVIDDAIKPV
jgi:hypothetical protein